MESKLKIMIVDDEPDFIENLRAIFEGESYHVVVAMGKAQAQDLTRSEKPDAIVLGTIMPRGDAFLLHQWLKKTPEFSDVPMLVIDAPSEKQVLRGWRKDEGLRMEASDYLVKPVEVKALIPIIEKMTDMVTERIKVLVVDDHAIVRDGIRALLELQRDIDVVGEAIDGKDALEKMGVLSPDVVLMDIVMPEMDGLEATRKIRKQYDSTKVLMLSQYDDDDNVNASKQAGAAGFVPKKDASTMLISAIRSNS